MSATEWGEHRFAERGAPSLIVWEHRRGGRSTYTEGGVPADGMRIAAKVWGTAEGGGHRLGYTAPAGGGIPRRGEDTDAKIGGEPRSRDGESQPRGRAAKGTTRLRLLPKGEGVPQHGCACIPQVRAHHNTAAPASHR